MNKVLKVVVMVGILTALVMTSACTLRASKPPAEVATPTSELQFLPTATTVTDAIATQTAVAKFIATATPAPAEVVAPTETPAEQAGGGQTTTGGDQAGQGGQDTTTNQARPIPTLERPSTYTLQKGEWPICIARRYDLNLNSFFSANGLNMNSRPQIGTVLKIPASGNWDSASHGNRELRPGADYKVGAGDSVYTIACYFGDVSPEAILAANGLGSAADVRAGMTLKIP
ncbi:MAG: LysM peptidoglycan-binding domain-containing protein [Anaerolineae bacterium]|nr:LysM peptidoglycan-binding domain-containing protein [Anaerolineae bacterium]